MPPDNRRITATGPAQPGSCRGDPPFHTVANSTPPKGRLVKNRRARMKKTDHYCGRLIRATKTSERHRVVQPQTAKSRSSTAFHQTNGFKRRRHSRRSRAVGATQLPAMGISQRRCARDCHPTLRSGLDITEREPHIQFDVRITPTIFTPHRPHRSRRPQGTAITDRCAVLQTAIGAIEKLIRRALLEDEPPEVAENEEAALRPNTAKARARQAERLLSTRAPRARSQGDGSTAGPSNGAAKPARRSAKSAP